MYWTVLGKAAVVAAKQVLFRAGKLHHFVLRQPSRGVATQPPGVQLPDQHVAHLVGVRYFCS
jgi:hypothetical protein